jgi:DNA-binding transcriptional regulator YhcF (GntR family)
MQQQSVQNVIAHVMDRLASGMYPPGSRLPTARELALELGVHRNTVIKAYKSLGDLGLVSATPGRGTFAVGRVEPDGRRLHAQQIEDRLAESILRARRSNISEGALRQTIDEQIAEIYHAPPPRGAFVECNAEDLRVAITEIEQQSDVRLAPVYLDALAADPGGIAAHYDVVFTSLFHLLEVRDLLAEAAPDHRIIGIYTKPDERALAEVAQIDPATRVGVVVSDEDGARRYRAQIQTYTQASMQVLVRPTDDAIASLAREVDLIVTSRSRAVQIRRLRLDLPMIELSFHISRESAQRVVEALYGAMGDGKREEQQNRRSGRRDCDLLGRTTL